MAELEVEVVAAAGIAFQGKALSVTARTNEGDIGILPNHAPLLAGLVPCAAEILTVDGRREVVAVDGGFISVAENRVSVLSPLARIASEIDVNAAQHELAAAEKRLNAGDVDEETRHHYLRASAQLRAAQIAQSQKH